MPDTRCSVCFRSVEHEGGMAASHVTLDTNQHCAGSRRPVLYGSEDEQKDRRKPKKHNPNFFNREPDGTVRLRIRFENEEASLFEEAAGNTPVMVWLHRTLEAAAKRQVREARKKRARIAPPE